MKIKKVTADVLNDCFSEVVVANTSNANDGIKVNEKKTNQRKKKYSNVKKIEYAPLVAELHLDDSADKKDPKDALSNEESNDDTDEDAQDKLLLADNTKTDESMAKAENAEILSASSEVKKPKSKKKTYKEWQEYKKNTKRKKQRKVFLREKKVVFMLERANITKVNEKYAKSFGVVKKAKPQVNILSSNQNEKVLEKNNVKPNTLNEKALKTSNAKKDNDVSQSINQNTQSENSKAATSQKTQSENSKAATSQKIQSENIKAATSQRVESKKSKRQKGKTDKTQVIQEVDEKAIVSKANSKKEPAKTHPTTKELEEYHNNVELPKYLAGDGSLTKQQINVLLSSLFENRSVWGRKELISACVLQYGLSATQLKERASESILTRYKSLTGSLLNEKINQGQIAVIEDEKLQKISDFVYGANKAKQENYPQTAIGRHFNTADKVFNEYIKGKISFKSYLNRLERMYMEAINIVGSEFMEVLGLMLVKSCYGNNVIKDEVTGGSNDNGIDGIVYLEDPLGIKEVIFIQAKTRKNLSAYVTVTELRSFVGVMIAYGATKGVMVTNAIIHSEGRKFANKVKNLVLMDAKKVFFYALKHQVGIVYDNGAPKLDEKLFIKNEVV